MKPYMNFCMHPKPTDHPHKKNTQHLDYIIHKRYVSLLNVGLFEYNFKASFIAVITDIVNFSVFYQHCQNLSQWTVNQLLKYGENVVWVM